MIALSFEEGTLRIEGDGADAVPHAEYDPRSESYRAPAHRYGAVRDALAQRGVDDRVLDLPEVPELASSYQLRGYQTDALDAWREGSGAAASAADAESGAAAESATDAETERGVSAPRRGVLELPTGSGKTVIGVAAIADLSTPTLVVVPTIDLLEQWREELETEFGGGGSQRKSGVRTGSAAGVEIGQLGGGVQRVGPITVATYDSAYLRADELGDRFGLVVFDEVHHLGGEGYREIARLLAAPARLGLTATFERPDDAHEVVAELVGPVVHSLDPDELAGEHLSPYDVRRLSVELTDEERENYDANQGTFTDYLARSNIQLRSGSDYQELVKRSGNDPAAREALLAKQRAREIMMSCDGKIDALAEILDRHRGERTIVFTAHNDFAYRIAERFLVPAITHRTATRERRDILEKFRAGEYTRVVTSNVLDEGIDVPDASVAVVLSGSGSEREFTQRLGRILRPSEETDRALLYEVIADDTAEEGVASRRR
ncbi:DEAD/DEAH box helicase family protein [Natronoarchaeum rubrum]|uniref:DEAD/DEAH box helicase family protein n=1 Tax=Natronoarchaeum rubrum TaxID=755311 RepID=UPI002112906E|nr:DEAD/DEAH box helicase family protein [Natronoarchaeum rubrum]